MIDRKNIVKVITGKKGGYAIVLGDTAKKAKRNLLKIARETDKDSAFKTMITKITRHSKGKYNVWIRIKWKNQFLRRK